MSSMARDGNLRSGASESRLSEAGAELRRLLLERSAECFPNEEEKEGKDFQVSLCKSVAYGSLDFSKTPVQLLISVHLLTFYQQAGASLGSIAFFTSTARCFDVLSDPIMAQISDSFSSRFGRRRPFILVGAALYGTCLFALCTPPASLSPAATSAWFGLFYILFFLTDTLTAVPHNALGQELTSDTDQRRRVFMVAKIFQAFGMICAAALPVLLGMLLTSDCQLPPECNGVQHEMHCEELQLQCDGLENRKSMMVTGLAFGVFAAVAGGICVTFLTERSKGREADSLPLLEEAGMAALPATKMDEVLPGFLGMLGNRPFRAMILPWILDQTIVAMLSALLPFYVQYVISPEGICSSAEPPIPEGSLRCSSRSLLGVGLVCMLLAAIFSMPMWQWAARRFGDYRTWLAFNFLNAITTILFILGRPSDVFIILTIVFAMLNGLPMGASFLTDNILGLVIDYDELRTGSRSEATFTMFASFIPKIVSVPASAFPLTVLALLGFKDPVQGMIQAQAPEVVWAVRLMFSVIPTLLALMSFALKAALFPFKDLSKADAEIKAGLALRKSGEPFRDPLDGVFRHEAPASSELVSGRAEMLLRHFTGFAVVDRIRSEGMAFLLRRCVLQLVVLAGITVAMFSGTALTMGLGYLNNNKLSWLPSVLVLLSGLGLLGSLVAGLRLRAALALRASALPQALLQEVCAQRRVLLLEELPPEAVEKIQLYTEEAQSILCHQRSVLSVHGSSVSRASRRSRV